MEVHARARNPAAEPRQAARRETDTMLASIRRPTFEDLNLSTGKRARLGP